MPMSGPGTCASLSMSNYEPQPELNQQRRRSRGQSLPGSPEVNTAAPRRTTRELAVLEEGDAKALHPSLEIVSPAEMARREIEDAKRKRNSRTSFATSRSGSPPVSFLNASSDSRSGAYLPFSRAGQFSLGSSITAVRGVIWSFVKGAMDVLSHDENSATKPPPKVSPARSISIYSSSPPADVSDIDSISSDAPDFDKPIETPLSTFFSNVSADDLSMAELQRGIAEPGRCKRTLHGDEQSLPFLAGRNCELEEEILSSLHVNALRTGLPARWRSFPTWILLYSTRGNGFSLSTLYGNLRGFKGPVILAIRDTEDSIFGAFVSHPFQPRIGHYGTGESFLWRLHPGTSAMDFAITQFPSTGKNNYFAMCEPEFLAVGCGAGKFGLWLDAELLNGTSDPVPTFDNETLSNSARFVCNSVEVWGLDLLNS